MDDQLFNELKQKYEHLLQEDFEKYNNYRKAGGWIVGIIFGIIFTIWVLMFTGISQMASPLLAILPIGLLVVSIYKVATYRKKGKGGANFNDKYQKTVVADLLSHLYTDPTYYGLSDNPNLRQESKELYNYAAFDKGYDTFAVSYGWSMKYGDHNLKIYDLHTQERHEDSDGNTTYVTTFKGLFGEMTLPHNFNAEIQINKRGYNYTKLEKVNMDSVTFNKEYRVCASDKVLAMQLLTHDIMDKILELTAKSDKVKFEFRIINDKLYYRIFNYNTFTHDGKELFDRKELDNDYKNAKLFIEILDIIEKSASDNSITE